MFYNQQNAIVKLFELLAKLQLTQDMNVTMMMIIPDFLNNDNYGYGDCITGDDDDADDDVNDYLWDHNTYRFARSESVPMV